MGFFDYVNFGLDQLDQGIQKGLSLGSSYLDQLNAVAARAQAAKNAAFGDQGYVSPPPSAPFYTAPAPAAGAVSGDAAPAGMTEASGDVDVAAAPAGNSRLWVYVAVGGAVILLLAMAGGKR